MSVRRYSLRLGVLISGLVLGWSITSPSYASFDIECTPGLLHLAVTDYDSCNNLPYLASGNDTTTNLSLLLNDLGLARLDSKRPANLPEAQLQTPNTLTELPWGALDSIQFLHNRVPSRRLASHKPGNDYQQERCTTLDTSTTEISKGLAGSPVSATERSKLLQFRTRFAKQCQEKIQLLAIPDSWSSEARQWGSYLNGAALFYNGQYAPAQQIFAALSQAQQPWVRETSAYMLSRVSLNKAVSGAIDSYGELDLRKISQPQMTAFFQQVAQYFRDYPNGRYVASARGLMRRGFYYTGQRQQLIDEINWQLTHPRHAPYNLEMTAVPAEIDTYILSVQAVTPDMLKSPLLLAAWDLQHMRPKGFNDDYRPLSWAALQQQADRFDRKDNYQAALFDYLQAYHLFIVQRKPTAARQLLSGRDKTSIDTALSASQSVLKGLILEQAGSDPATIQRYWAEQLQRARSPLAYSVLEAALAIAAQNNADDSVFVRPDSPIRQDALRLAFIRQVANATSLRQLLDQPQTPKTERLTALYALLQHSLMYQDWPLFLRTYRDLPADVNRYQGWQSKDEALQTLPPLASFTWTGITISPTLKCPALHEIVINLSKNSQNPQAQLCLGEFVRAHTEVIESQSAAPRTSPQFADVKPRFAGRYFTRGEVYQNLMQQSLPADLNAYVLYRAIQCYAPSGLNDCQNADVAKSTRKQWYDRLKTAYPNSSWARSLKYYW